MTATNVILAAVSICDPTAGQEFKGSLDQALNVMVEYAAGSMEFHGDNAQHRLTEALRVSDADRVAEIAAAALLRLAGGAR